MWASGFGVLPCGARPGGDVDVPEHLEVRTEEPARVTDCQSMSPRALNTSARVAIGPIRRCSVRFRACGAFGAPSDTPPRGAIGPIRRCSVRFRACGAFGAPSDTPPRGAIGPIWRCSVRFRACGAFGAPSDTPPRGAIGPIRRCAVRLRASGAVGAPSDTSARGASVPCTMRAWPAHGRAAAAVRRIARQVSATLDPS